ncbi:hypothetical protein HDV00_003120 [Rhizophlyctis rosea]|nr:hypothetical protein HDV00_003120 [Rhizophlyctis rosea]
MGNCCGKPVAAQAEENEPAQAATAQAAGVKFNTAGDLFPEENFILRRTIQRLEDIVNDDAAMHRLFRVVHAHCRPEEGDTGFMTLLNLFRAKTVLPTIWTQDPHVWNDHETPIIEKPDDTLGWTIKTTDHALEEAHRQNIYTNTQILPQNVDQRHFLTHTAYAVLVLLHEIVHYLFGLLTTESPTYGLGSVKEGGRWWEEHTFGGIIVAGHPTDRPADIVLGIRTADGDVIMDLTDLNNIAREPGFPFQRTKNRMLYPEGYVISMLEVRDVYTPSASRKQARAPIKLQAGAPHGFGRVTTQEKTFDQGGRSGTNVAVAASTAGESEVVEGGEVKTGEVGGGGGGGGSGEVVKKGKGKGVGDDG